MADCKAKVYKVNQHSKVVCQTAKSKAFKYYSENSGHCFANFTIQLILCLCVVFCSVFLSDLFHYIYFFSVNFWHQTCMPV